MTKNAIVYGGAGSLGAAVAAALAQDGCTVHLVGRTRDTLDTAARTIGTDARVAVLDALDEAAVDAHVEAVTAAGTLDVSINLISRGDVQGVPLTELATDDLMRAVDTGLRSNFVTARAAARVMAGQGHGSIVHLNSASGAGAMPGMGSTGPADAAIEAFYRYLAAEVGPSGVRVNGIWTAGVAESLTREKLRAVVGDGAPEPEVALRMIAAGAALRRTPRLADVVGAVRFLAGPHSSGMTGTMLNVTCGLVLR